MKNLSFSSQIGAGKYSGMRTLLLVSLFSLAALSSQASAQERAYNPSQPTGSPQPADETREARPGGPQNPALTWAEADLYNFCTGATTSALCYGWQPEASLIVDSQNNLYGTTVGNLGSGNEYYCKWVTNPIATYSLGTAPQSPTAEGTVFEYDFSTRQVLTLYTFQGDEANPVGSLMFDTQGNLWGTTCTGGQYNLGTVFQLHLEPNGSWQETFRYSFGGYGAADGANPVAGLVEDTNGNLYGTTVNGGTQGVGTVFEISPGGGTYNEMPIYNFGSERYFPAQYPAAPLSIAPGNGAVTLFGTTAGGGINNCPNSFNGGSGCGTVFELDAQIGGSGWNMEYLWWFQGGAGDGATPVAGLVEDANGNLYGTTEYGGANFEDISGAGTVFEVMNPGGIGGPSETVLYNFCSQGGYGCTDGANPVAGLILDNTGNGDLYGTTMEGGLAGITCEGDTKGMGTGCGTAFALPLSGGTEQAIYAFNSPDVSPHLQAPEAGLVQNSYGNLYGTVAYGGPQNEGAVYELYTPCKFCWIWGPGELAWGDVAIGQIGAAKYVKLTNTGTETGNIGSIQITGADASQFALVRSKKSPCGSTLAPGATCLIGATFNPTQLGPQTGTITITDNAENSPQTVSLSGTGIQ